MLDKVVCCGMTGLQPGAWRVELFIASALISVRNEVPLSANGAKKITCLVSSLPRQLQGHIQGRAQLPSSQHQEPFQQDPLSSQIHGDAAGWPRQLQLQEGLIPERQRVTSGGQSIISSTLPSSQPPVFFFFVSLRLPNHSNTSGPCSCPLVSRMDFFLGNSIAFKHRK